VRWGLPDVLIAWGAGFLTALFATPLAEPDAGITHQPIGYVIASAVLQNVGVVAALVVISRRKGLGTLRQDFGLVWPFDRLTPRGVAGWLGAGAALSLGVSALLAPINLVADLDGPAQEVSKVLERSSGAGRLVFALVIVFVAPPVEELLFRGALLRALQRRWSAATAIFVSAAAFAGIHLLGGLGSGYVLPGLMLLGLVSGYEAVKHGNLARSVLLHMGFNLLTAIFLVLG
jgi:membrane protease YdiL (CAAX protease family)